MLTVRVSKVRTDNALAAAVPQPTTQIKGRHNTVPTHNTTCIGGSTALGAQTYTELQLLSHTTDPDTPTE